MRRFDVIVVVLDKPDPVADKKLADHVVDVHERSHPGYVRLLTHAC